VSLTYATYEAQILDLIPSMSAAQFTVMSPGMIDYAEQRIYRELNLLTQVVRDSSGALAASNRNFTFPSHFVVTETINVVTPAGTTNPELGTRVQLTPTTKEVLDVLWSSASGAGVPTFFAMVTDQTILVGPWPDHAYTVEVIGTQRPTPLSATNTTTFLTLYLPDLFIAASMVYASGWMRNFGSQSDDPKMAASWEAQYGSLKQSADVEELRKRFSGPAWTSEAPSPIATPTR